MKKTILALPVMALGLLLATSAAQADDWGFSFGDDDWRVHVSSGGGRHHPQPRPQHVCRYEWRQVTVQDPGRYENIWVPGGWESRMMPCGMVQQVWVPAHYEQRFVPGATRLVWQRVRVCRH